MIRQHRGPRPRHALLVDFATLVAIGGAQFLAARSGPGHEHVGFRGAAVDRQYGWYVKGDQFEDDPDVDAKRLIAPLPLSNRLDQADPDGEGASFRGLEGVVKPPGC